MMMSLAGLVTLCLGVVSVLAIAGVISPIAMVLMAAGGYLAVAAVVCGLSGSARG